jgi:hypothetical protein
MLKKLSMVALLVLAINFLAVAGGAGYLLGTGKLDKEKITQIAAILFPPPPPPAPEKKDEPDPATTQPLLRLDRLLEQTAGKSAGEQVEFIRSAFDAQAAVLDRQRRELLDMKRQIELAQSQLEKDRADADTREKSLADRATRQAQMEKDEGFAGSLAVYNTLPTKQVKDLFMGLDEPTVVRYLQAMDPSRAGRILKEFKTPEESSRAQSLLEAMRRNDASPEANAD